MSAEDDIALMFAITSGIQTMYLLLTGGKIYIGAVGGKADRLYWKVVFFQPKSITAKLPVTAMVARSLVVLAHALTYVPF